MTTMRLGINVEALEGHSWIHKNEQVTQSSKFPPSPSSGDPLSLDELVTILCNLVNHARFVANVSIFSSVQRRQPSTRKGFSHHAAEAALRVHVAPSTHTYRFKPRSEQAWSRRGLPLVASWGTSRVAPGDTKGQEPMGLPAAFPRPRLCGAAGEAMPSQGLAAG